MDTGEEVVLTVELKNSKPLDLIDLTSSLMALAQSFQDYATEKTRDPLPGNMRLFVREIRAGSVVADLVAMTEQFQWIAKNIEVLGGFVANVQQLAEFFLGRQSLADKPTPRQAQQISQIVEPIAKDAGAQMNIQVSQGGVVNIHQHVHFASMDANAIQNGVNRFLGPGLPAKSVEQDQLMVLEQVKNHPTAKTGDRGIIEAIWPRAVKLQFLSEEAKRRVLELQENPLQCVFVVDVDVRSVEGKPTLYRIINVTDVIPKSQSRSLRTALLQANCNLLDALRHLNKTGSRYTVVLKQVIPEE